MSTAHAWKVKNKIKGIVIDMLTQVLEQEEENMELTGASQQAVEPPAGERYLELSTTSRGETCTGGSMFAGSGVASSTAEPDCPAVKAKKLLDEYLKIRAGAVGASEGILPFHRLLAWWKDKGMFIEEGKFAPLGKVFKILLSVPGAAAGLERDFSVAGSIVTSKRSSLDGAWVEMVLFLYLNRDLIPAFQLIAEIDEKKIDNYIPLRLRDQSEMAKFIQMDQDAVALRDQQRAAVQEEEEEVLLAGGGGGGGNDSGDDEYIPGQNADLD